MDPSIHRSTPSLSHTLPPLYLSGGHPAPRGIAAFHPDALQQPLDTHTDIISVGLCVGAEDVEEKKKPSLLNCRHFVCTDSSERFRLRRPLRPHVQETKDDEDRLELHRQSWKRRERRRERGDNRMLE